MASTLSLAKSLSTSHKALPAIALLASLTIAGVGCTRDVERPSQGSDQTTANRTGTNGVSDHLAQTNIGRETKPNDNIQEGESARQPQGGRAPASENAPGMANDSANVAVPRDEKGIAGSPYASNIKNSNLGQSPSLSGPSNISQYNYEQREQFKSDMTMRLQGIGSAIDSMKGQITTKADQAQLQTIDQQRSKVAQELAKVDNLKARDWAEFRKNFSRDLVALEKNYQGIATAPKSNQ